MNDIVEVVEKTCENQNASQEHGKIESRSQAERDSHVRELIRRIYREFKKIAIMQEKKKMLDFLSGPEGSGSYGGVYIVPKYSDVRKNSVLVMKA